jgi:hypothetical protein
VAHAVTVSLLSTYGCENRVINEGLILFWIHITHILGYKQTSFVVFWVMTSYGHRRFGGACFEKDV